MARVFIIIFLLLIGFIVALNYKVYDVKKGNKSDFFTKKNVVLVGLLVLVGILSLATEPQQHEKALIQLPKVKTLQSEQTSLPTQGSSVKKSYITITPSIVTSSSTAPVESQTVQPKVSHVTTTQSVTITQIQPTQTPTITQPIVLTPSTTPTVALEPSYFPLVITKQAGVVQGGVYASEVIKTLPNASCTITITTSGGVSTSQGLFPQTASSDGTISWLWQVDKDTVHGNLPIIINCNLNNEMKLVQDTLIVQ